MANRSDKYQRQPDPRKGAPLSWIFKRGEQLVASTPDYAYGQYKKLVVGQETWFVHCSYAGALDFVLRALGEDNVDIDEEAGIARLVVPADMVGAWIGAHGCVVGFLKQMFGLKGRIQIDGDAKWRHR